MARLLTIDLRSLALFRVALGLAILVNLANLAPWAADFFSDQGVLTRDALVASTSPYRFSVYLANGKPLFVWLLFGVHALAALGLILGWRSQWMAAANWLLLMSLINRNPFILQGGDQLITLLAFWGMFLPLGARWSVDAALADKPLQGANNNHRSIAGAAILAQVLYVYFIGALLKDSAIWIPDGEAVYYATHLASYATPLGEWLAGQPGLARLLTYYVWSIELAAPFLLLSPVWHVTLRGIGLAGLIAMHLGFALFLHIGLFWLISITSLLLFVPGAWWDWLAARVYPPAKRQIALYYDEGCVFCEKTCRLLRTFCLTPDNPILIAQRDAVAGPILRAHNSWVVIDANGAVHLKWRAVAFVLRQSPVFWWLGWLTDRRPLAGIGAWLYDRIGLARPRLGRFSARWLPYHAPWPGPGRLLQGLVGALALLVLAWNIVQLPRVDYTLPRPLATVIWALNLDQYWNMFAPYPARQDGWLVIAGEFTDGSPIELWSGEVGPPPAVGATDMPAWHKDYRWRKYVSRITDPVNKAQLHNFARYYCRLYNRFDPWPLKLRRFSIRHDYQRTLPPGQGMTRGSAVILHWKCLD